MDFDACDHRIRQLVIRAAMIRREDKGLPPEDNITRLYKEMAPLLGIPVVQMSSNDADHLPGPYEMGQSPMKMPSARVNEITKKLLEHKQICPKCGKKSMEIFDICRSCADFKAGFRSEWRCIGIRDETGKIVDAGCGEILKTNKFMGQWFKEFADADPEFKDLIESAGMLSKQEMGIKTVTDDGLK
jgi:hypothetical protein